MSSSSNNHVALNDDDIRGNSGGGGGNNDNGSVYSNSNYSIGSSNSMIQVRFPSLPLNPPTDSEPETSTSTTPSADNNQAAPSSGEGRSNSQSSRRHSDRTSSPESDSSGEAESATGATGKASETDHQQDEQMDEMERSALDIIIHNDPEDQIKTALGNLVAMAKKKKRRLEELRKQNQSVVNNESTHGEETKTSAKLPRENKQKPAQVIMTWMDTFQDNEKIQLLCLQSLPTILEDPSNRLAAQSDGLASIVLYNMAAFPNSSLLQLTAFHTLVVLLRPLGAHEGAVNKARVHSHNKISKKGIRSINHLNHHHKKKDHSHHESNGQKHAEDSNGSKKRSTGALLDATFEPRWEENGVRVMLDSLRRFASDRYLQAMGCWAMVNAALYPSLKTSLLRLGGVYTVTNAMMLHPNVEAVQFRGLFALINLVIPDNKKKDGDGSSIHSHIYQIARLTVVAMKNFHTNKSILNRGCLVLRNLSLTPAFVKILARTPGCVDMLLHCRTMCPKDALVQRSARTIMILVQRVSEKDGNDTETNSFPLTQPRPAPASAQATNTTSSPTSQGLNC